MHCNNKNISWFSLWIYLFYFQQRVTHMLVSILLKATCFSKTLTFDTHSVREFCFVFLFWSTSQHSCTHKKDLFSPQFFGCGSSFASGQQRWVGWMHWHPHRLGAEQHVMEAPQADGGARRRVSSLDEVICIVTAGEQSQPGITHSLAPAQGSFITAAADLQTGFSIPVLGTRSAGCCSFHPSQDGLGSPCVSLGGWPL